MAALIRFLVVVLLLAIPIQTRAQRPQPTFLAVVDGQGRLTPIAVYDGATWWNRWPLAGESNLDRPLPLPPSIAAIPADWLPPGLRLPVNWQAVKSGKRVSIRALRPERSPQQALMTTVNIVTTYRGLPHEEDTPAISGPGVLADFVSLAPGESDSLLRQLESRIAALEADAIASWRKEVTIPELKDVALTRTYMVEDRSGARYVSTPPPGARDFGVLKGPTPINGLTYHYLHGEKLFTLGPDADCMMNLSTRGLIVADRRGRVESEKLGASAFAEYCGDAGETTYHLATITIGRRTWWVVKVALEDGYDYGLIDPVTGEHADIKGLWGLRSNSRDDFETKEKGRRSAPALVPGPKARAF